MMFYLSYVKGHSSRDKFFTQYGTYNHKIHELCERNENVMSPLSTYLLGYQENVRSRDIEQKTQYKYYEDGKNYWRGYSNPPEIIGSEIVIYFSVFDHNFKGVIDLLHREDGKLVLCDHKTADIAPRSKRGKPTKKDKELDRKLRQLYLYSIAVKNDLGKYPDILRFNCFRTGQKVDEPFKETALNEAKEWAGDCIKRIQETEKFHSNYAPWVCEHICGQSDNCELYQFNK